MADELPEDMLYQGVRVDIAFADLRPSFGDLFRVRGDDHPRFTPTGGLGFERLAERRFEFWGRVPSSAALTHLRSAKPTSWCVAAALDSALQRP